MDYIEEIKQLKDSIGGVPIEFFEDYAGNVYGDFDWSFNYNEFELAVSKHYGDWQVQRQFVVGIGVKMQWVNPKTGNQFIANEEQYEKWCQDNNIDVDNFDEDELELEQFSDVTEEGEFLQYWLHVPSGRLFVNERLEERHNGTHLSVVGEWNIREADEDDCTRGDCCYYYDESVHPTLIRNGYTPQDDVTHQDFDGYFYSNSRMDTMHKLLNDPDLEWLFKVAGMKFAECIDGKMEYIKKDLVSAFRIVKRHHYDERPGFDLSSWADLIEALALFHKDIHNPSLVCPENFSATHDYWMGRMQKEQERVEKERQEKIALQNQDKYYERVERYKDIRLEADAFVITPCLSIKDMQEEGRAMHHCVGSYWNHENSLILFCRDHAGNRISTIELNTRNWTIPQNHGLLNHVPPFQKESTKLVLDNIKLFRNAKPHSKNEEHDEQEKVLVPIPVNLDPEPQRQLAALPMAV